MTTGRNATALRDESGVTILEATMVFPLFLILIIFILECCVVGYHALSNQYLASYGVRYAVTGRTDSSGDRLTSIRNQIVARSQSFGRTIAVSQTRICAPLQNAACCDPAGAALCPTGETPAQRGQYVMVRITTNDHLLLGLIQFKLEGVAAGRNEDF